mmetsp:Transcript_23807/g.34127  ORF Transcript_23807/g.34127 Transcript_23807/m.34127 type:complete len:419 (+) Transcript_23807:21-1277(+)
MRKYFSVSTNHDSYDEIVNSFVDMDHKMNDPSLSKYQNYPFLQSMLRSESSREYALKTATGYQQFVKSSHPWFETIFIIKERAIERFAAPLALCTLNAVVCYHLSLIFPVVASALTTLEMFWSSVDSQVFSTTLAFLLVFRINRIAVRWWESRTAWGNIVWQIGALAGLICQHLKLSPKLRDRAIAWTLAFPFACKQLLRGENHISREEIAGILDVDEISVLEAAWHPPHYAAAELRNVIFLALSADCTDPDSDIQKNTAMAIYRNSVARSIESLVNSLIQNIGSMERIRNTPLPVIYTTHLRTYLLLYLLTLPYLYGHSGGYLTVVAVFLTSFGLLGIDGAAAECESPFSKGRANHLDMEAYCLTLMKNVVQICVHYADMEIQTASLKMNGTVSGEKNINLYNGGLFPCNHPFEHLC